MVSDQSTRESDEPMFHSEWERHVFPMSVSALSSGLSDLTSLLGVRVAVK